uniref:X8 domain-containing protein n=1 Tax=Oryza barthii TaxID=65489 RepID=A0A0D3HCK6_9ORYZ
MEFLVAQALLLLVVVSNSLLLPSLGLAGQEAHEVAMAGLHDQQPPSPAAVAARVSVAHADLPMVASSVLGAESWLRAHVLAHYPSNHVTAIAVAVACARGGSRHGQDLRASRAAKNLHHALVRWGLVDEIKIDASSAPCAEEVGGGALKRRLYGMHHLPPPLPPTSVASPPPPGVPLSMAPCSAPPTAAMSPQPWSGEGGNGGGQWCVAKPTVPLDRLQEAMDYACSQDGVDCQEISAGGSCFYPDSIAAHASYAFNSYWQKMKHIGGSCSFGGTAVLINSDPSLMSEAKIWIS